MTTPFHLFEQQVFDIPRLTSAWVIPTQGDGYQLRVIDLPSIGSDGILLDEPFWTQYEGALELVLSVNCELRTRLINCHVFQDGTRFSSVRERYDSLTAARQHDIRFNDFSSVSRVTAQRYRSSDGNVNVTPELARQPIQLQVVLEFLAYQPGSTSQRIAAQVDSATAVSTPRVSWWQLRAERPFPPPVNGAPVIPEYIEFTSHQDPHLWMPWPETAYAEGRQLGTLDGLKQHLSVGHGEDDDLLTGLLDTARGYVGDYARLLTTVSASGATAIWHEVDYTRRLRIPGPVVQGTLMGLEGVSVWIDPAFPHDGYVVPPEGHEERVELQYTRAWTPYYGETGPRRLITTIYRVAGALYLYREATMAGDKAIQQLIEGALGIKSDVRL